MVGDVIARPFRHKSEGEAIWAGRGVRYLPDCHVVPILSGLLAMIVASTKYKQNQG